MNPLTDVEKMLKLRQTSTVRAHAQALLARAVAGGSSHWQVKLGALPSVADAVAQTTRQAYPSGRIPFHSRWRHFEAGGVDRKALLDAALSHANLGTTLARAQSQIDLTIVSVLLDAGAGAAWRFAEGDRHFSRSEGLGVASFHGFVGGVFSTPTAPLQVRAERLQTLSQADLAQMFQASADNPVTGLDGRCTLMHRLGATLAELKLQRPSDVLLPLLGRAELEAHDVLAALLDQLSPVWPTPSRIGELPLGDCWPHSAAPLGWVPFHKLSQWLTYSLLEPLRWAGVNVTGLDALTGLPEYRNGGLFIDGGVLEPVHADTLARTWQVSDELVVEWRALTVALLDAVAPLVRKALGKTEAEMPLACILEGGTWATGRRLAQRLRGGEPPLKLALDGTVF